MTDKYLTLYSALSLDPWQDTKSQIQLLLFEFAELA